MVPAAMVSILRKGQDPTDRYRRAARTSGPLANFASPTLRTVRTTIPAISFPPQPMPWLTSTAGMVGVNMDPKNECADWDSSGCSVTGCQPRCLFTKPKFTTIKGLDSFDGERWGGLEALDLFSNAYNSWDANGRKNGWATADVTTREGVEQLVDGDITRAKGLVSIPICSFREALDTLYGLPTRRM